MYPYEIYHSGAEIFPEILIIIPPFVGFLDEKYEKILDQRKKLMHFVKIITPV